MSYISNGYTSVKGEFGRFVDTLTNTTVLIPLAFIMIALWLNGSALWGAYWEEGTAMAYILMLAFVFGATRSRSEVWLSKLRVSEGVRNFALGFMVMFAGLICLDFSLGGGLGGASISKAAVYPAIAITIFFVAPVEETIFRGVLKEYFERWRLWKLPLGIVITSAAFAMMHYAVYGGAVMSLWWAFIMGGVFYMMATWKGVPSSTGAHSAYNLFVLGILSGGIV